MLIMLGRSHLLRRIQSVVSTPNVSAIVKPKRLGRSCPAFNNNHSTASSNASHMYRPVDAYANRPNWQPGLEPGLDPSTITNKDQLPHAECEITVVDFSEDRIVTEDLDNATLPSWVERSGVKDEWVKCRWINVSSLSWDVIQVLGNYKGLHRLAIEDMVNREKRTKVDWYSDHMHIVLTLQKLVHSFTGEHKKYALQNGRRDGSTANTARKQSQSLRGRITHLLQGTFSRPNSTHHSAPSTKLLNSIETSYSHSNDGYVIAHTEKNGKELVQKLRTLQGHRGGADIRSIAFMEAQSPLTRHNFAVCAEQVSIFLLSDNTVISFFEASANDVERPILTRLNSQDTILRRSCDASMLVQSIIDTIIDLAIPVTAAYQDAIRALEIDVLTEPNIKHARELYIITSEIASMQNSISPIAGLITSLQDSRSGLPTKSGLQKQESIIGIQISSMTQVYLGDVKDHCFLISQTLDQLYHSANGMINLIFNTITAYQNESMKKLTGATIMFLPLTFITGYFGMNLTDFPSLQNNESFFWSIATPVAIITALTLGWGKFWHWILKRRQRRLFARKPGSS